MNIPTGREGVLRRVLEDATRAYLCSSEWPWAEATRALITRKTYGGAP